MVSVAAFFIFVDFLLIIFLWIRNRKRRLNLLRKYGIPGPKPNFFTGNLKEFSKRRIDCIKEWTEEYGKIFGFYLGAKPYIVCSDVELLQLVQIKNFRNFSNRDRMLPDLGIPHESVKKTLGLQKDEQWKHMRNIMSASFSSRKIKLICTLLSDPINIFLKNIEKQDQNPCNLAVRFRQLIFDSMCRILIGIESNVQYEENSNLMQSVNWLLACDVSNVLSKASVCFPEMEPAPTYLRLFLDIARRKMNFTCARTIFETVKQTIALKKSSAYKSLDILQTFIEEIRSKDKEKIYTDETLLANIVVFMLAGYETVSSTLEWCVNLLAHHTEIQDKVRQEINANIPYNKNIEYTDMIKLKYLDQVLSETLRHTPTSPILVNRICAEDFKFKDMTIPKGVMIASPLSLLHKDSQIWQKPDLFDPDRFSPENRRNIIPVAYQPFGAGPRMCIAYRLARTIVKLVSAHLIRSFKLYFHEEKATEKVYDMFLSHPKNNVLIKAVPTDYFPS